MRVVDARWQATSRPLKHSGFVEAFGATKRGSFPCSFSTLLAGRNSRLRWSVRFGAPFVWLLVAEACRRLDSLPQSLLTQLPDVTTFLIFLWWEFDFVESL